jgi:DNA-binding response OmpR family regulator
MMGLIETKKRDLFGVVMNDIFKKKIAIIEDSKILLKMTIATLKKAGFDNIVDYSDSVVAFQEIAEDQLSEKTIDLVISDLNMPGLDGLELVKRLKEDENTKDLKIIILTGEGDQTISKDALNLGINDYIVKPFDKADLVRRVYGVLES